MTRSPSPLPPLLPHRSSTSLRQTQFFHAIINPCPRASRFAHHRLSHSCLRCRCGHIQDFHSSIEKQSSPFGVRRHTQISLCQSHIKIFLQKGLLCRDCHNQSFCEFCVMGPPLPASSPKQKKLRVLCLHGFRTNGKIMETQLAKLDRSVLDRMDMVCLDAPYPAAGKSDVEGFFPPPYYEWFQFERTDTTVYYKNLDACIQFISDFMEAHGPFDGLVGFSQGAFLSAALAGMQQQGLALTSVPPLRFTLIISGGSLDGEHPWMGCYSKPIRCPSVHLIGENDFLKPSNEELLLKFKDPIVVRHAARHTVPRLDAMAVLPIIKFLEDVRASKEQEDSLSLAAAACA